MRLGKILLIFLFFAMAVVRGEYLGNIIIEYDMYSGNLVGAIGGGVKEGYKGFSRSILGGSSMKFKFNYYTENLSWLQYIEASFESPFNIKPDGYTKSYFWQPVNDTYKEGSRSYTLEPQWVDMTFHLHMFENQWESTVSSKLYWENSVLLLPVPMSKETGFYPYVIAKFNFIPNSYLKNIEDDYAAYLQKYYNKTLTKMKSYWNPLELKLRLDYTKGFEKFGEKDFFWLLARAELFMSDTYFKDDPIGIRERTEFTFLIPKSTFSVMLFQEMSFQYFNRPEAWQSENIYRSGAIWWTAGVRLAYRIDIFKN